MSWAALTLGALSWWTGSPMLGWWFTLLAVIAWDWSVWKR